MYHVPKFFSDVLECQEGILGRRLLRGKFGRQSEEEEQSEVVADDEVVSPGRSRPRFRSRQRAMRGPLIQSARQRYKILAEIINDNMMI